MDEAFRILDDGRVFFDYGPASMVVTARRGDENLSDLAASAFPFLRDSLSEIAGALPILRPLPERWRTPWRTGSSPAARISLP